MKHVLCSGRGRLRAQRAGSRGKAELGVAPWVSFWNPALSVWPLPLIMQDLTCTLSGSSPRCHPRPQARCDTTALCPPSELDRRLFPALTLLFCNADPRSFLSRDRKRPGVRPPWPWHLRLQPRRKASHPFWSHARLSEGTDSDPSLGDTDTTECLHLSPPKAASAPAVANPLPNQKQKPSGSAQASRVAASAGGWALLPLSARPAPPAAASAVGTAAARWAPHRHEPQPGGSPTPCSSSARGLASQRPSERAPPPPRFIVKPLPVAPSSAARGDTAVLGLLFPPTNFWPAPREPRNHAECCLEKSRPDITLRQHLKPHLSEHKERAPG